MAGICAPSEEATPMDTRNILLFVHGIMLEEHPPLGRAQYRLLWDAIEESHPELGQRFEDVDRLEIEWGKFVRDTIEPDQWINLAEEHLARILDPDEVRKNPNPNNLILPQRRSTIPTRAWDSMVGPLRQILLIRGLGDMFYYCGSDGQIAVQLSVFHQILEAMEAYRHLENLRLRLHVVAHSLGVSIANDLLHALFSPHGARLRGQGEVRLPRFFRTDVLKARRELTLERLAFWRNHPERLELGAIASLGSSLPLMILRSQRVVDLLATGNTLPVDELGIHPEGRDIVWKNFYDDLDPLSLPVRPLFGDHATVQDVQVRSGEDPWGTQAYWGCPDVQMHVAELLARRAAVPAPPVELYPTFG